MLSVTDRDTHTHTCLPRHTHPRFAQRVTRLGADSPPAVREMPVSPAALQRGGGRKEGKEPEAGSKGRRGGAGARERRKETEMLKDAGGEESIKRFVLFDGRRQRKRGRSRWQHMKEKAAA